MSFVKKVFKKKLNFLKRIRKRAKKFVKRAWQNPWVRAIVIAAATVFTAGLAAGGFAAFSGVSSVGGFFSAVGSTMATGWSAMASYAAKAWGGVKSMFGAGATTVGGTTTATAGTGSLIPTAAQVSSAVQATTAAAQAANASTLTKVATGIGKLFTGNSVTSTAMRSFIVNGITAYTRNKELEWEKDRYRNRTVYGGPAFGGEAEVPEGLIRRPEFGQVEVEDAEKTTRTNDPIRRVDPYGSVEEAQKMLGQSTPIAQIGSPLLGSAT